MGFSLKSFLGGKKGPSNPYSPVDFAALYKQDLEAPGGAYDYGGAYKTLMGMIGAPSSVDAVRDDVYGAEMQNLLSDTDTNTKTAYGSTMADMADRGLVGEGQSSDIAMNALGTVNALGARTKSGIQSQYAIERLNRLTDKERRAESAQAGWMNTLASMAESARGRNLQRMLGLAGTQAGAYSNAAQLANTYRPGLADAFKQSFGSSFGQKTGEGVGSLIMNLLGGGLTR